MRSTDAARRAFSRTASRRAKVLLAVLGAIFGLGILGAGVAFGYWITANSSNLPVALADSLPQGATPSTPTTTPNLNSNTVTVSFSRVSTTTGNVAIPASDYSLNRYPAAGGSAVPVTASCSGSGTITCTESSVPDGKWQYTDTPTYPTNWVGTESAKSATVIVDTTPPTVSVTFPANNGNYNASGWTNGGTSPCGSSATICGQAADATSGISGASSISLTITQSSTSYTWNGTSFVTGANTVAATTYVSGTGLWTYGFANTKFPADGTYTVSVTATDQAGNTSAASTNTFKYDTTAPTVSVTFPANNGNYNASGWTNGGTSPCGSSATICGQAADATSGISGASSISLTITQSSTSYTWNGTSFVTGANTVAATTYVSGTGLWTYGFANTKFPADGTYTVSVTATDQAGNTSAASTNTFKYDTTAPTVSVTFPANNGNYNASGWTNGGTSPCGSSATICGQAADATSGISGASSISLTITQSSTSYTWNGTSFVTGANTVRGNHLRLGHRAVDLRLRQHQVPGRRHLHRVSDGHRPGG